MRESGPLTQSNVRSRRSLPWSVWWFIYSVGFVQCIWGVEERKRERTVNAGHGEIFGDGRRGFMFRYGNSVLGDGEGESIQDLISVKEIWLVRERLTRDVNHSLTCA